MKRLLGGLFFIMTGILPALGDDVATPSRLIPGTRTSVSNSAAPSGGVTSDPSETAGAAGTVARTAVVTRRGGGSTSGAVTDVASTSTRGAVTPAPSTRTATASRVVSASGSGTTTTSARTSSRATGNTGATQSSRDKLNAAVNTVGRNARVTAASINNTSAVRRAGVVLRPTTAEVGGRAVIAGTDQQTGSNIKGEVRTVQSRAATVQTRETIAEAKDRLVQASDLSNTCQQQYNDCMDQFCAVIDANQKRCSCSANLSAYTRSETAVKDANSQLNDVAQRIRYVGLSADEIRAILNATEAEEVISGTRDTSESRNMLEEIENMIANPATVTSSSSDSSSFGLDMNIDFSNMENMFNLDFLNNNSSGISRKRGTELYNSAKKQCANILNRCKSAGASADQITANYELAIDKDCIAYEQGLTKMNETLVSNVRSAKQMLEKARLAVLNNKNLYGSKECVAALDTCMKDDMVCGANYAKCLDPTKRYIDENGKVVLGQNITNITSVMSGFDNTKINLESSLKVPANCSGDTEGACIVHYLMEKIGMGETAKDGGLCRAVLDKCQRYTYNSGTYNPYNDIVYNYIQRAMVNIRAAQTQIISDYASSCLSDLSKCYSNQVSQVNTWSASANADSIYRVMNGACYNVALTCAYAVFANSKDKCPIEDTESQKNKCITSISEVFYQSLLCPVNSTYTSTAGTIANNGAAGYANSYCKCKSGYLVYNGTCVACDGTLDTQGKCVKTTTPTSGD